MNQVCFGVWYSMVRNQGPWTMEVTFWINEYWKFWLHFRPVFMQHYVRHFPGGRCAGGSTLSRATSWHRKGGRWTSAATWPPGFSSSPRQCSVTGSSVWKKYILEILTHRERICGQSTRSHWRGEGKTRAGWQVTSLSFTNVKVLC